MSFCIHVKQLLALLLFQFATDGTDICMKVVSNIQIVKSCPRSKEEWNTAAYNKKCTKIAEQRNCTNTKYQFQYHCVINAFMNETLEVCAPSRFIFGHCTEYNHVGGVIQSHFAAKCNTIFPKCERIYNSRNAYKYPDCYELVYKKHASTTTVLTLERNKTDKTEHREFNRGRLFILYSALYVCMLLLLALHLLKDIKGTCHEICKLQKFRRNRSIPSGKIIREKITSR